MLLSRLQGYYLYLAHDGRLQGRDHEGRGKIGVCPLPLELAAGRLEGSETLVT